MKTQLYSCFIKIADDRIHGAAEIYSLTLKELQNNISLIESEKDLLAILRLLINRQPAMAPLLNLASKLLYSDNTFSSRELKKKLEELILRSQNVQAEFGENVVSFYEKIRERIWCTFSFSSTVLLTLATLFEKNILPDKILIPESRPGSEGLRLYHILKNKGFPVVAVSDMCLLDKVSYGEVDRVLIGCDALSSQYFVNKSGTNTLIKLASINKTPVDILTQDNKFLHPSMFDLLAAPDNKSDAIYSDSVDDAQIDQPLFAYADIGNASNAITESGEYSRKELVKYCKELPILSHKSIKLIFDS